jgi:hypothetical protein
MLKEQVKTTATRFGGHRLGKSAQLSFEPPKPLVPAVTRINVENEEIPFPTWSEPNVRVQPFPPPILYLIAIRGRVLDAVSGARMLAWTCTINTPARTPSLYNCVQRDNGQTDSGICKGLRFLGDLFLIHNVLSKLAQAVESRRRFLRDAILVAQMICL